MRVIATAVLARLLTPADFGLLGMAAVFFGLTAISTELGPSAAIIGRARISDEETSSLFWASTLLGALLAAIAVACSPLVAALYREPRVAPVFAALSLTVFLAAEALVHNALLRRRMDFRTPALANLASVTVNSVVAIATAIAGAGYWSLVAGTVAGVIVSVLIVQSAASFRPSLRLRWSEVRPFATFSTQVTGAELANYGALNADNLLVGRLLGASSLGVYALAYNLVSYPVRMFSSLVAQVTLPAFGRMAGDAERFRSAYERATRLSAAVVFPVLSAALVAAPELIVGVYGPGWEAAILPFRLLCLAGMARSVGVFSRSAFKAAERADLQARWDVALLALVVAASLLGARAGVAGVAAAVAVATLIANAGLHAEASRLLRLPASRALSLLAPAAALGLGAAGATLVVDRALGAAHAPALVAGFAAVLVALALTWLWGRGAFSCVRELEQIARSVRRSRADHAPAVQAD